MTGKKPDPDTCSSTQPENWKSGLARRTIFYGRARSAPAIAVSTGWWTNGASAGPDFCRSSPVTDRTLARSPRLSGRGVRVPSLSPTATLPAGSARTTISASAGGGVEVSAGQARRHDRSACSREAVITSTSFHPRMSCRSWSGSISIAAGRRAVGSHCLQFRGIRCGRDAPSP